MNTKSLPEYLEHIRRAAQDACDFLSGLSKQQFLADRRTQNAVVMSLIVVGEAATKVMDLHPEFAASHPCIPWRQMRGMRNRITHGYFEVDFDMVWDTVTTSLPELVQQLSSLP